MTPKVKAGAPHARELATEIAERLRALGPVTVSRFFAGTALRWKGLQFGFVMKGSLYLRVDTESVAEYEAAGARPFSYAGATKRVTVASYYEAPSEVLEDPDLLVRWASTARRAAESAASVRPVRARSRARTRRG